MHKVKVKIFIVFKVISGMVNKRKVIDLFIFIYLLTTTLVGHHGYDEDIQTAVRIIFIIISHCIHIKFTISTIVC